MAISEQVFITLTRFNDFQRQLLKTEESVSPELKPHKSKYIDELYQANALDQRCFQNRLISADFDLAADRDFRQDQAKLKENRAIDFQFGKVWSKDRILQLARTLAVDSVAENIREALISMAARMQNFIQLARKMPDALYDKFKERISIEVYGASTVLKFSPIDGYSLNFESKNHDGTTNSGKPSNRESDHSYSMSLMPFNLRLEKKVVEAKGTSTDPNTNPGGWKVGSLIHTITLDKATKEEGEADFNPVVLEIGVKPDFSRSNKITTKLFHKSNHNPDVTDLYKEEDTGLTNSFQRSLDISFPKGFLPQKESFKY